MKTKLLTLSLICCMLFCGCKAKVTYPVSEKSFNTKNTKQIVDSVSTSILTNPEFSTDYTISMDNFNLLSGNFTYDKIPDSESLLNAIKTLPDTFYVNPIVTKGENDQTLSFEVSDEDIKGIIEKIANGKNINFTKGKVSLTFDKEGNLTTLTASGKASAFPVTLTCTNIKTKKA